MLCFYLSWIYACRVYASGGIILVTFLIQRLQTLFIILHVFSVFPCLFKMFLYVCFITLVVPGEYVREGNVQGELFGPHTRAVGDANHVERAL